MAREKRSKSSSSSKSIDNSRKRVIKRRNKTEERAKALKVEPDNKAEFEDDEADDNEQYDDDDGDYSSSDADDDFSVESEGSGLNVTFEFKDMQEEYVESITTILKQVIVKPHLAFSVASKVCDQVVGTAVLCEGATDVYAFSSLVPLLECPQPLKSLTDMVVAQAAKVNQKLHKLFKTYLVGDCIAQTAVLLHARFSNFPLPLIPPLHKNLVEDLEWAQQQNGTTADTACFLGLTHVLILAPLTVADDDATVDGQVDKSSSSGSSSNSSSSNSSSSSSSSSSNNSSSNNSGDVPLSTDGMDVSGSGASSLLFDYFEDELYVQESTGAIVMHHPLSAGRAVAALVPVAKLDRVMAGIKALAPE